MNDSHILVVQGISVWCSWCCAGYSDLVVVDVGCKPRSGVGVEEICLYSFTQLLIIFLRTVDEMKG